MVAILLGAIFSFTTLFLVLMFLGVFAAAWPLFVVVFIWLAAREHRLYREALWAEQEEW